VTPTELQALRDMPSAQHRFAWVQAQATLAETLDGCEAYRRYNTLLRTMVAETGHSLRTACGVFSALSPNNDYLGNLRDASILLRAQAAGSPITAFRVHTYGSNKRKAWAIAGGVDPADAITAPKTRNFFLNLLDPGNPEPVTIDGHMFNIWNGSKLPLASRDPTRRVVGMTGKRYQEIADELRKFAAWNGLIPNQAQAILWLTWRRLHGIKTDGQTRFWDLDLERAGLGFGRLNALPN